MSVLAPMFSLPSTFLRGNAAAAGIALFNSLGVLGGFTGPYVVGIIKEQTGNYAGAMLLLAACLIVSALVVLLLGRMLEQAHATATHAPAPVSST